MLDNATLTLLVASAVSLGIKPLWPALNNNLIRALVGVIAYAAVLLNYVSVHALTFSVAWSLLPQAGGIAGAAIATYHILTAAVSPDGGGIIYPSPLSPNIPPIELEGPVKMLDAKPAVTPDPALTETAPAPAEGAQA